MIHSYSTEVALEVGGVPEAVVLKEIAYWCKKNAKKGINEREGRAWTFGTQKDWQDMFPEFSVKGVLSKLRQGGWLLVGNYNENAWDHTLWYAPSEKALALLEQFDSAKPNNRKSAPVHSNKSGETSGKTLEEIQKNNAEVVDRIYALYPTKSESGNRGIRSTGKCSKDKQRIAALLRTHTPEQIERSIRLYVEETGGRFLKNFSTFLNNMPEYEDEGVPTSLEEELRAKGYQ